MSKSNTTIVHSIMNSLAKDIIQGAYDCEKMLPSEHELSIAFSASRTSIRNALQSLASKGMISIQAKKRCVLNDENQWNFLDTELLQWISEIGVKSELFNQLIILRLMLEPNISALAAINATGKDLANLELAIDKMHEGQKQQDSVLYEQGDIDFHQALLLASNNIFFISLAGSLKQAMLLSFKQTQEPIADETYSSIELHQKLLEVIRMRDSQKAYNAMTTIITSAALKYEQFLDVDKYQFFLK